MLLQLLSGLLGLLSMGLTLTVQLVAQLLDIMLVILTDLVGALRHLVTRISAILGRSPPPRK